jgi:hypothetical protein
MQHIPGKKHAAITFMIFAACLPFILGCTQDQNGLAKCAISGKDMLSRLNAVQELTNIDLIIMVALEADSPQIRKAAEGRLSDQDSKSKLAAEKKKWWSSGVKDAGQVQSAMEAVESLDFNTRLKSIKKVTDQALLAKVLKRSTVAEVRALAICKVDDTDLLRKYSGKKDSASQLAEIKLALSSPFLSPAKVNVAYSKDSREYGKSANFTIIADHWEVKVEACGGKLSCLTVFSYDFPRSIKAYPNDKYRKEKVRITAHKVLYNTLAKGNFNQSLLSQTALNTDNIPSLRCACASLLTDPDKVSNLAATDKHPMVRRAAVQNKVLDDQKILTKIAFEDKDIFVRAAAVMKISDQAVLDKIAKQDKDSWVRRSAKLQKMKLKHGPGFVDTFGQFVQ